MANECMNYIKFTGNKEEINLFKESYLVYNEENNMYELDFNYITPIPNDCENDYTFRIEHWGNKWDGTNAYVEIYDDEVYIDVSTAWGPCVPIVDKLIRLCPGLEVDYKYYESGCAFLGYRYHVSYEDPDDDEQDEILESNDPYGYWTHMFIEEYETYDWLAEHIGDMVEDGELTEEKAAELLRLIESRNDAHIVERCLEEGVL
jgi:hypothetical protein